MRRFLVPSELPWGFSPIALPGIGEGERRALNALIGRQNADLQLQLDHLAARRGLVGLQPDVHGLFLEIHAAPEAWGFRDIHRPVLSADALACAALTVPEARGVLWWDGWGHLTSAFHRLMAERALQALGAAPWRIEPGGQGL